MSTRPETPENENRPADTKAREREGKEAQEANEAMNKAKSDETAGKDSLIPGLRQSDTGGSAD